MNNASSRESLFPEILTNDVELHTCVLQRLSHEIVFFQTATHKRPTPISPFLFLQEVISAPFTST